MDYEHRLLAAAEIVLSSDRRPPLDSAELGVTAALKPHQIEGVSWLLRRYELGVNVILGDEMGLGKTLQAISLLSYLKSQSMSPGPFLVLCPLSVTDGWASEFQKFCPTLRVTLYVGDKGSRRNLRKMMCDNVQRVSSSVSEELPFDVLLTTYDIALMDQNFLSQIPWHYAVIDEAQRLKNSSSVLYNALEQHFVMPRRLLLTGTPIQNNLSELWALMHFCMPSIFGTLEEFLFTFKEAENSFAGDEVDKEKRQFIILKHVLRAFMLRRTKASLIESGTLELPLLTEITVMVPLAPLQKKLYLSVLRRELKDLLSFTSGGCSHQSLKNIVIQLRKACSHPYLFNGIEPEPYEEGEHLVQASGKLIILDQLLKKLHPSGHRVLLFAQMTHTLDILQDYLELRKYTYERLDGSVRAEERFAAIRNFSMQSQRHDSNNGAFVFMISTRAGGVGLNLVAADTVIFYEQDWNPQADKQALQRAHRIGQLNHVLSINLVTERTIDEVVMRRAERKLKLSHSVIGEENGLHEKAKDIGIEPSDMRSLIFGLQMFDPTHTNADTLNEEIMTKLQAMTDRVVNMRNFELLDKDNDQTFEIKPTDLTDNNDMLIKRTDSMHFDSEFDETAYLSWVEKFKEASQSIENATVELERRRLMSQEKELRLEADKKKAEEKKLAKWEALGYRSLAINDPNIALDQNIMTDSGSVQFVYGDCTEPSKFCATQPAIIFCCMDDSGVWGHGGVFDALANLSSSVPDAYHCASECGDLHVGDLHLIELDKAQCSKSIDVPTWVALAIVQSYNARRKVPRSPISISDLELCLSKASFSAAQNSATIHMPRIGYQDGSQRSEWYAIERLLRKYASLYGVAIFVYYFRRSSREQHERTTSSP